MRIWISGLILMFCTFGGFAQSTLRFEDCLNKAFENNVQIKQAEQQVLITEVNESQAKYNLLPSINGSVSLANSFGKSIDPSTNQFVNNGVRSTSFSLSGNLPLFAGFQRWKSIKQSGVNQEKSEFDFEKTKNDVALMVASAYLQVLLNKEVMAASEARLGLLEEQVETTSKMVDAGRLPVANLLDIKAQQSAEQFTYASTQGQYETSRLQLAQLMGMENYTELQVETPSILLADSASMANSQEEIIKSALENFPQIKSAEKNIESNEIGVQISKARYAPSLNLNGGTFTQGTSTLADFGVPYREQYDQFLRSQMSVSLSIPILNNLNVRTNVKLSQIQLKMAELSYVSVKNQLVNDVQKAYLDVNTSYKNYLAAKAQFETMDLAQKNAKIRFDNNMLSGTDYRVSLNNRMKAESDLIQAKYRYVFNSKILDFYLGNEIKF